MATQVDVKDIALRHGDKVAFGVVFVFVLLHFVSNLSDTSVEETDSDLGNLIGRIESNRDSSKPPELPQLESESLVASAFDPTNFADVGDLPSWAFYKRVPVLREVKRDEGPRKHVPAHNPPSNVTITAEMGQMVVSWQPATGNRYVTVARFRVYRREGDGELKQVGEVPGDTKGELYYVDAQIKPNMKYWYLVSSVAAADKDSDPLPAPEVERKTELSGPHESRSDVVIHVLAVEDPDEQERLLGRVGKAYLKIFKWDPATGEWREFRPLWIEEEQPIQLKLQFGAREETVDTGYVLKEASKFRQTKELGGSQLEETVQQILVVDERGTEKTLNDKVRETLPQAGSGKKPGAGGPTGTGGAGEAGGTAKPQQPAQNPEKPGDNPTPPSGGNEEPRKGRGFFGK